MNSAFNVGRCPICKKGWGEIVKDGNEDVLIVMCSDCDTIWSTPEDFKNNLPDKNKMKSVEEVVLVTKDEITEIGWDGFII